MALLPLLDPDKMQARWKAILDPFLKRPTNSASILKGVVLKSGPNTINHLLGQTMQGWYITDQNAAATIYRSQPMNALTLTLVSSAPVTVNIGVF